VSNSHITSRKSNIRDWERKVLRHMTVCVEGVGFVESELLFDIIYRMV
jgi:hypothetical protein